MREFPSKLCGWTGGSSQAVNRATDEWHHQARASVLHKKKCCSHPSRRVGKSGGGKRHACKPLYRVRRTFEKRKVAYVVTTMGSNRSEQSDLRNQPSCNPTFAIRRHGTKKDRRGLRTRSALRCTPSCTNRDTQREGLGLARPVAQPEGAASIPVSMKTVGLLCIRSKRTGE